MDNISLSFPVTLYGNLEVYSETLSKSRCRIFYKYGNRNGTYITDEFAENLRQTLPYAPIKGIYEEGDYGDHGLKRSEGRIYGVVPFHNNFAWEDHLDKDGKTRTYACCDVLLYTAIYKEAGEIAGKGQSMELYDKSIDGEWQIINGKQYFVFTKGSFLGLQVLGDMVEPCFEGAGFEKTELFSLYNSLQDIMQAIENYHNNENKGGATAMSLVNFRLSDGKKHELLFTSLNTNFNEEGNWCLDYGICEVYDEYALVVNYQENCFERVYYTKDNTTESVTIGEKVKCFVVDVTEKEKVALEALQVLNGGTYELSDEQLAKFNNAEPEGDTEPVDEPEGEPTVGPEEPAEPTSEPTTPEEPAEPEVPTEPEGEPEPDEPKDEPNDEKNSEFALKIKELQNTIATLTSERDNAISEKNSLSEQVNVLSQFRKETEDKQKLEILDSYVSLLPSDIIENYKANLSNFSPIDLDKELAYELRKTGYNYSKNSQPAFVPKGNNSHSGIEQILAKYKKN